MNSVFSEQILADKLSKLNSTQQCIESILSLQVLETLIGSFFFPYWFILLIRTPSFPFMAILNC